MIVKRKLVITLGITMLLGTAAYVGNGLLSGSGEKSAAVETASVVRRDIRSSVLATGIIKPMVGAEVKVGSRISGVVSRLYANIGDFVRKGQLIAQLDTVELVARLTQNRAALESAKASLDYAKADLERQKALFQKNLISQQEYDAAVKSHRVAEAQLHQAEANLAFAEIQLDYARITSPISGIVASISTQAGEAVSASLSAPTFVTIIDLNRLEVQAFVDETDIGKVKVGLEASFTVDTYPDVEFKGKCTAIYPKAILQNNVVNYITTIAITDFGNRTLRPEMTASVSIFLGTRTGVLAVPNSSVKREKGERFVYVLEGDKLVRKTVKVGWKDSGYTEITSGLSEGEKVIVGDINRKQ